MRTGFLLNETVRLETLRSYAILDTAPDAEFDDLARLAATLCDVPVSLITLVDSERHWFKSRVGFERSELPRNRFYCTYAVDQGRTLLVEDTQADERFADWSTSVVYRFYAGVPLTAANGAVLGTLCVLDEEPRTLTPSQLESLQTLARQVMAQLELHRHRVHRESDTAAVPTSQETLDEQLQREIAARQHYEQELRYHLALFENVSEAVISTDLNHRVRTWNGGAERMYGFGADAAIGEVLSNLIATEYLDSSAEEVAHQLAESGEWSGSTLQHTKGGRRLYVLSSISQIRDGDEEVVGVVAVNRDITEQYQAERALFEREQQFRRLAEGLPEYIYILDLTEMRTLFANKAEFLGYSDREWRNLSLIDKVHPDDQPAIRSYFRNFMDWLLQGEQPEITYRFRHADGGWAWLRQRGIEFVRDGNQITQAMITLEDVSESQRLEAEIEQSLEKRGRQVAVIGEIGREIATAGDLETLFSRLVNSVKEAFDYYYIQVLRYDPASDAVALVYGYGDIGQQMMAMHHSMPMGVGIIGRAAATGESQLRPVLRTGDADWQPNTLLPRTRGELAVPIKLGEEVLGVLDVQSDQPHQLSDEDRLLLESLCNQIAIAVESTRLRLEMESQVREMSHLQRLMSRDGWRAFQSTQYDDASGYVFDRREVQPLVGAPRSTNGRGENGSSERKSSIVQRPLAVRGEVIGQIGIAEEPERPLSEADQALLDAVSDQVAEALETARLLEQTQKRAVELETVAQVSTATATNLEQEQLLQSVVDLTKFSFDLYHVHIYLVDRGGQHLVLTAGAGDVGRQMVADGWRISLEHPRSIVARAARQRQGVVVDDVRQEAGYLPNELLPETRSELAVPMVVGQELLGVLDVQSSQRAAFGPDDVRIQSSLASQVAVALQNAGRYQEQLQTAEKLREVDRLKSEFLASMSHELRTPLNSIIGFADVLLEGLDGELTPRMEEDVTLIRNSGQHLRNLIGDILDMSKIEAGKMELNFEKLDPAAIVREVMANAAKFAKTYDKEHLELEVDIEEDLPRIDADRTRLIQVLYNLVSNAIKFTSEGSVTISLRQEPESLRVAVSDTGIGIDPNHADLVFEQFRQVDGSMTRTSGGTGLGLPITRHLVGMHGGDIWLESEPGEGTTFHVRLPIRRTQPAKEL